ncbi:Heme oxygenase [Luteibacter sp. 22Crub2.1]|nr:Heme oxygenase [Luteibacter sp. 22Crub2.1]
MDDIVAPRPAHLLLREETREAHEDTEASGGMRRLMDGELDVAGYEALLRAQLALFEEWEADRAGWLASDVPQAGWSYVSRASLLRGDLAVASGARSYTSRPVEGHAPPVGASPARDAPAPAPAPVGASPARDAPASAPVGASPSGDSTRDSATCWGELYVIEGSALGGRLIVRRLRELYPDRDHRFYAIGEEAPSAWRRFQHILDTQLHDDASRRAAVDGARRMFARFRQTLMEPAAHV